MQTVLLQLDRGEERFLPLLKPLLLGKANVHLNNEQPVAVMEVVMRAREKGTTKVATSCLKLLQLLVGKPDRKSPTIEDYAGSMVERNGIEFLIVPPLEHLVTVPYGRFLYERYFHKFLHAEEWLSIPQFEWELFNPARAAVYRSAFAGSTFISCDIETTRIDRAITCMGFTAVHIGKGSFTAKTVVVPATDSFNLAFIKTVCDLDSPKVFQNGKYDNAYLLRYGIATRNWAFDTAHIFHSWYSELPKRLDFITSFMLRKWQYWKDDGKSGDLLDYYRYNAKDAFTTAMVLLAMMREVPDWAWNNYNQEFPLVFPCLLAEMTGIKTDLKMMEEERVKFSTSLQSQLKSLQTMVGNKYFNPSSPTQVKKLFISLGCEDIKDTTPPSRDKVANRHPLNKRLVQAIEKYRKDRKLLTSYLTNVDEDGNEKVWHGRMFYSLNPHGTDTGRLASKESAFWCGTNIQNQPRDRNDIEIKRMYHADEGFFIGEADGEQAEARDTAYLSGDVSLIAAVESPRDFHAHNASCFFGVRYEDIVADSGDVIDKELRDLSKRTNHGSNYNMGEGVMLDTMGIQRVIKAKHLLRLPARYSLLEVTRHLLSVYKRTYPVVKGAWYDKVKADVHGSGFLVGPTGWTRKCFSDPSKSKAALNEYVAHPPQSLNAMVLNKAFLAVFFEIALKYPKDFRLVAQIHDSIVFMYRKGREDLAWKVKELMEITIPVTCSLGITRNLTVPVSLKGEAERWSEIKKLIK